MFNEQTPVQPAPAEPAAIAVDTTNWKAKFEGAEGTWKQERTRADKLAVDVSNLNQQLEAALLDSTLTVGKSKKAADDATLAADGYKTRFEKAEKKIDVMALLNTDEYRLASQIYSDADSLDSLLGMEDEARKTHLAKVVSTITGLADQQRKEAAKGSVPPIKGNPPAPGTPPTLSVVQAKEALETAFRLGATTPEYKKARDEYYAVLLSQGKT